MYSKHNWSGGTSFSITDGPGGPLTRGTVSSMTGQSVSHVALICPKNHKNSQKRPKIEHFSNTFDNIYLTKTLRSLKIGYPSGPALLLTVDSGNKLLPSVFEAFSSQQVDNFKMAEMASF